MKPFDWQKMIWESEANERLTRLQVVYGRKSLGGAEEGSFSVSLTVQG